MGKAIVYCGACGKSLLDDDFQKGRAVRTAAESFCAPCSPIDVAALPARRAAEAPVSSTRSIPKLSATGRMPKVSTGRIPTISTRRIRAVGPGASTAVWLGAGGILGVLALLGIVALSGPSRPSGTAPAAVKPPSSLPRPAPKRPAQTAAPVSRAPDPTPDLGVEEEMRRQLEAQRAGRLDRGLAEVRRLIETSPAGDRVAEIDGLLDALSHVAGDRVSDVAKLRALHEERLALAAPPIAPAPAPSTAKEIPPGLEGRWTLEGLRMGQADDVSGHDRHATAFGTVAFVPGRLGLAAAFDGGDGYLELPRSEALDRLQEGPYTLSAWFKPADIPRGPEHLNGAFYGIVIKHGLHVGLSYSHEHGGSFEMMHWLRGVRRAGGPTSRAFAPGAWYHLAGTADPGAGRTRLHVNGEQVLDVAWPAGDRVAEPGHGRKPWRIGIALPKAKEWGWSAKGAVDDVRLYSRVLDPAEIAALAAGR